MFENLKYQYSKFAFGFLRAQFYYDLSRTFAVSKGENLKKLLEIQAERHKGAPTGVITGLWVSRMDAGADSFHTAILDTVPYEDYIALKVCETGGDLGYGLEALGKNLLKLKETREKIIEVIGIAVLMVGMLIAFCFAESEYMLPMMFNNMKSSVDITKMGEHSERALLFMDVWGNYGVYILGVLFGLLALVIWSLPRWTGEIRSFFDKYFIPYQLYRGFKGPLFFSTLSIITQKIGGDNVMALSAGLEEINKEAMQKPDAIAYMHWHSQLITQKLSDDGFNGGEIFNTGLMDKRIFYSVLDMGDYTTDIAKLMSKISEVILEETPKAIHVKIRRWRFGLQAAVVFMMVAFYFMTVAINDEFATAMELAGMK